MRVKALKRQQRIKNTSKKENIEFSGKPSYSKFRNSKFRFLTFKNKNVAKKSFSQKEKIPECNKQ